MKEALVDTAEKVEIVDSPIPRPEPGQVLIKVVVSGSNPKDWKYPELKSFGNIKGNSGDDIAGIVHAVGKDVYEFKPGDRVAAFHQMLAKGGSFAEYAIAWAHTTCHIPDNVSFEEAATVPLVALTAAVGNYGILGLPSPWTPATEPTPFIVYGASTAVGAFAIKLAMLSNIHPIIGIAGKGAPFAKSLIDESKGDVILDYRLGSETVIQAVKDAMKKTGIKLPISHGYNTVSEAGTHEILTAVMGPESKVTTVLPIEQFATEGFKYPDTYKVTTLTNVGTVHGGYKDLGFVYFRYIFRALGEGKFKAHPYEVVPGGLYGITKGLQNLKSGKASAIKYVFRVPETEGAGRD